MLTPIDLFSLLPVIDQSQLVNKEQKGKLLGLLELIISHGIQGLNAFKEQKLIYFDAQVGENLCQIRAYQLSYLAKKYLENNQESFFQSKIDRLFDFHAYLDQVKKEWDKSVKETSSYNHHLDAKESANEFLVRLELHIELPSDVIYLIACYFLARFSVKKEGILQSISLEALSQQLSIAKSQAKKLISTLQNTLCVCGIHFIHELLNDLPELAHYKNLSDDLVKLSEDSRVVFPCFAASEIIFHHALKTAMPILLIIRRIRENSHEEEILYGLLVGNNQSQAVLSSSVNYLSDACIVIEAEVHHSVSKTPVETLSNYATRLLTVNPIKALLANTAIHPQYAGRKLLHLADNPYQEFSKNSDHHFAHYSFLNMRQFASFFGCCKDNPSTLLMLHAYASTVAYQLESLKKENHAIYEIGELIEANPLTFTEIAQAHQKTLPALIKIDHSINKTPERV